MCPELDELEQYVAQPGGLAAAVKRHIDECSDCRSRLDEIAENLRVAAPIGRALGRQRTGCENPLPKSIGAYRILRELGRGGMGRVYEAEQDRPRRAVALKVIEPGFLSPAALRRFEYESQVLGRLQHPGIAQIYEAGTAETEAGPRPYFAMEIIRGESLRDFAGRSHLSTVQRLVLVAEICDAVHHAHQKGVIHRDLKPGNVIIDESGKPKILDFGVARAVDAEPGAPRLTSAGSDMAPLIGTLPYMSPEQVSGDPAALDTRSDVYALGVILYELLSGKLPYDLSRRPLPEAARVIREVEPAPLSSVCRRLRGDVETIVSRALEKDRERRYASAAELAADIRRYLRDDPIVARPPSALYQLRKFARRNTAFVAGAGIALAALIAGTAVSAWQAIRATSAEAVAEQRLKEARAAQRTAEDKEALAQRAAAKFKSVNEFLHDMLAAANPETVAGRADAGVRDVLDQAAARLDGGALAAQPEIEAAARTTLGNAYRALADYDAAEPHLRRAVELGRQAASGGSEDLSLSLNKLARLLEERGEWEESEALFCEALAMRRRLLGDAHPDVGIILNNLGHLLGERGRFAEAEAAHREALRIRRAAHGAENSEVATSLNNLGILLHSLGRFDEAEACLRESLAIDRKLRGEHVNVASTIDNLGSVLRETERYDEAAALLRESLDMRRRLLGDDHPDVATGMNNLALVLRASGSEAEAEHLLRASLEIDTRRRGATHPRVATTLANLAALLRDQERLDDAEELYRAALSIRQQMLGHAHPDTIASLFQLAGVYGARGDHARAEPLLAEVVECGRTAFPEGHWYLGVFLLGRGKCLTLLDRFDEAEAPLLEAHQVLSAVRGAADRRTVEAIRLLVTLYETRGSPAAAAEWRARLPSAAGELARP